MKNSIVALFFLLISVASVTAKPTPKTQTLTVKTSAKCGMCKSRIERDMSLQKGVEKATLDLDTKMLTVTYKPKKTNVEKLKKAVTEIGYDADEAMANQKSHDKLPACCQKSAAEHHD